MTFTLTDAEKTQISLFKLVAKKASGYLQENNYTEQDISNTECQCVLLFIRKLCQVYKDLKDNSKQTEKIKKTILSYLKIIYHTGIQKTVKEEIKKFIESPNSKQCDKIISAIYDLDIEDFSIYIISSLITHINRGNPKRTVK